MARVLQARVQELDHFTFSEGIASRRRRCHFPVMSDDVSPFADFLNQRREDITAEWLRRVRRDRKIPSADDLPKEELLDHLPYLLDTLIKQLREH